MSDAAMRSRRTVPTRLSRGPNGSPDDAADNGANRSAHGGARYGTRANTNRRIALGGGYTAKRNDAEQRSKGDDAPSHGITPIEMDSLLNATVRDRFRVSQTLGRKRHHASDHTVLAVPVRPSNNKPFCDGSHKRINFADSPRATAT